MSSQQDLDNLATYLKTSRERARLSVEDVAAEVGCTARYIYRIEEVGRHRGNKRLSRELLQRICALVGADYNEARRVGGYPEKSREVQALAARILAPVPGQEPPSTAEGDATDQPTLGELWDEIEEKVRWLRDHDAPAGMQWIILDQLDNMCDLTKYQDKALAEGTNPDYQDAERPDVAKQINADVAYIIAQRPPVPMLEMFALAVGSYAGLVEWREKLQTQELAA
jgi:transcriptional regulator with XRE-family HTH domain